MNPTSAQKKALTGIAPPPEINSLDNVIALCVDCHTKYDKDFKIKEYHDLLSLKLALKNRAAQFGIFGAYPLENEVKQIIDAIADGKITSSLDNEINYDPSTLENKTGKGMSKIKQMTIRLNVTAYYVQIKTYLKQLEQVDQHTVSLLQSQIRTFYFALLKQSPGSKDSIFEGIVSWLHKKSKASSDACLVLAAFFVQNCEIFDADA